MKLFYNFKDPEVKNRPMIKAMKPTLSVMLISIFVSISVYAQPESHSVYKLLSLSKSFLYSSPDSALFYGNKALHQAQVQKIKYLESQVYQHLAQIYRSREDYGQATAHFIQSLKIEESLHNSSRIAELKDELGGIYLTWEKFQKAMDYFKEALGYYLAVSDSNHIASLYGHLGLLHGNREYCENRTVEEKRVDYKLAIDFQLKSLGISERNHYAEGILKACSNLSSVFNRYQKPEIALRYDLRVLDYYKKHRDSVGITEANYALGETYRRLRQYEKSIAALKSCISESVRLKQTEGIQFVYGRLAQTYSDAGDCQNSLHWYIRYMTVRDSVYNNEKSRQVFELESRYQNEKKEKDILNLQLRDKQKQILLILILIIFAITLMLGLFLLYRSRMRNRITHQKNQLHEQKIAELERERKLVAIDALLHGEEVERTRLARDLHDGLGGLLSGIKLSLNGIRGNAILTENHVNNFDKALGLLDASMRELRRVAHNMMPEALSRFGLKAALTDFCSAFENSENLTVNFQYYGDESRLDSKLEITVYRITQELVNNAMKHARASRLMIQVVQETNRIHLTVQDNGCGFDMANFGQGNGLGISNIKSRVEALNGRIDADSRPGKGTEISVEFSFH